MALRIAKSLASHTVQATVIDGMLLERYSYSAGAIEPLPPHAHPEYQLGLSFDQAGEYRVRGARHTIPPGTISVIGGGETHAPSDRRRLDSSATFTMLYIDPAMLLDGGRDIADAPVATSSFSTPAIADHDLALLIWQLHSPAAIASRLTQQTLVLQMITRLLTRHADRVLPQRPVRSAHPAVERVRAYLHDHYAANVSLDDLARLADLSRYHLCRVFRREVGVPPHVYQTQIRIQRAKRLLARGTPPIDVARLVGFYDQSHFGQHFKRWVGITPARYARSARMS
jgi:AraC-like DNA-binding protein